MHLRPYQEKLEEDIREAYRQGFRSACAVLSCGGGKSVIAASIAKKATDKGNQVLFIVHRKELCAQIYQTFIAAGVDMTLCLIGMVQTVTRRIAKLKPPEIIICDESHHCLSDSYRRIFDAFPKAFLIGFTATPVRLNDGGLGKVMDKLIGSVSAKWLIENHYLSPYEYYSVPVADVSRVRVTRGEYDARQLSEIMENQYIYGETVKNYRKLADGKKAIVYCVSVESAKQTATEFRFAGYTAESLDGKTDKNTRTAVMDKFRNSEVQILCNCELFGEGLDVPDVECVILLRKTKSLTLYVQQSMRAMRYKPNKTAVIIDHVGNVFEHDFPDTEREWTLETKKRKAKCETPVKQCDMCFHVVSSGVDKCPSCGYEFPRKERGEKEVVDFELQQITEIFVNKPYNHYLKIKDWQTLEAFRKAKKFKFMWSIYKAIERGIVIPDKYSYHERAARQNLRTNTDESNKVSTI